MKVGDLSLVRMVTPDGNPSNPWRIQTSVSPREVEDSADLRMRWAAVLDALNEPAYPNTMNGQVGVDPNVQLFCSGCGEWKPDNKFARDKSRIIRRGRCYQCIACQTDARQQRRG